MLRTWTGRAQIWVATPPKVAQPEQAGGWGRQPWVDVGGETLLP